MKFVVLNHSDQCAFPAQICHMKGPYFERQIMKYIHLISPLICDQLFGAVTVQFNTEKRVKSIAFLVHFRTQDVPQTLRFSSHTGLADPFRKERFILVELQTIYVQSGNVRSPCRICNKLQKALPRIGFRFGNFSKK